MKRWIHATSDLDKKYRGVWYNAAKDPISVKDLLDKIIKTGGRGFLVTKKTKYVDDRLLEDGQVEIYLMDEERRGKLKLTDGSINYLIDGLGQDNWISQKLIEWAS